MKRLSNRLLAEMDEDLLNWINKAQSHFSFTYATMSSQACFIAGLVAPVQSSGCSDYLHVLLIHNTAVDVWLVADAWRVSTPPQGASVVEWSQVINDLERRNAYWEKMLPKTMKGGYLLARNPRRIQDLIRRLDRAERGPLHHHPFAWPCDDINSAVRTVHQQIDVMKHSADQWQVEVPLEGLENPIVINGTGEQSAEVQTHAAVGIIRGWKACPYRKDLERCSSRWGASITLGPGPAHITAESLHLAETIFGESELKDDYERVQSTAEQYFTLIALKLLKVKPPKRKEA